MMENQYQCPNCGSYKVSESLNIVRGLYVGGLIGAFMSLAAGSVTFELVSLICMIFGIVGMVGDEQWLGLKRIGVFFCILAPLLVLWLQMYIFNGILASIGILLFFVGLRNQNKTASKMYECSDCGYRVREDALKAQSKTVSQ